MNRYPPPYPSCPITQPTYPMSYNSYNPNALSYPNSYDNYARTQNNYTTTSYQANTHRAPRLTGANSQPVGNFATSQNRSTPNSAYQLPPRTQSPYTASSSYQNANRPHTTTGGQTTTGGNSQPLNQIKTEPSDNVYSSSDHIPPASHPSNSTRLPSQNSSPASSRGAYTPTTSHSHSIGPVPRPIFNGVSKAPPKTNPYKRVSGKSYKNIWLRDKIKLRVTAGTADEIKFAFAEPHEYDAIRYTIAMPSFLCSKTEYKIGSEIEAIVWNMKIRSGQFTRRINMTDCFDQVQLFEGDELPLQMKNHPGYSFRAVVKTHDTVNHEIQVDYFGMRKILLNAPQCHYSLIGNWLNIRSVEVQPGEIQWVAEDFPGFEHLYKK